MRKSFLAASFFVLSSSAYAFEMISWHLEPALPSYKITNHSVRNITAVISSNATIRPLPVNVNCVNSKFQLMSNETILCDLMPRGSVVISLPENNAYIINGTYYLMPF